MEKSRPQSFGEKLNAPATIINDKVMDILASQEFSEDTSLKPGFSYLVLRSDDTWHHGEVRKLFLF